MLLFIIFWFVAAHGVTDVVELLHKIFKRTEENRSHVVITVRLTSLSEFTRPYDHSVQYITIWSWLTLFRAYGSVDRFVAENIKRIDRNMASMWAFEMTGRWSGYRLDMLGSFIILGVASMTMFLRDSLSPGLSGMLLTVSFQMVGAFQWAGKTSPHEFILTISVRSYAETENNMAYYERLQEYNQTVKPEAPRHTHVVPPASWPKEGAIKFDNVMVRYRDDLQPVLKNTTFSIRPREKIGIVGRTGAGKSTLATVLFRLVEPTEGTITIDGINIGEIGLGDLRSKLAIIPQVCRAFWRNAKFHRIPCCLLVR